jgi:hypothetical protein
MILGIATDFQDNMEISKKMIFKMPDVHLVDIILLLSVKESYNDRRPTLGGGKNRSIKIL